MGLQGVGITTLHRRSVIDFKYWIIIAENIARSWKKFQKLTRLMHNLDFSSPAPRSPVYHKSIYAEVSVDAWIDTAE